MSKMGKSKIETGRYWDKALQLVDGCTKCSPACLNCWAEAMAKRFYKTAFVSSYCKKGFNFSWNGRIQLRHDNLDLPLHTRKPTVFSIWNDLFHEKVPFEFITQAFDMMCCWRWPSKKTKQEGGESNLEDPKHIYLVLTKRPQRISEWLDWVGEYWQGDSPFNVAMDFGGKIPKNIFIGCTPTKPEDIETLLQIPASHRFISLEPLISPSETLRDNTSGSEYYPLGKKLDISSLSFCIVGAETGPNARFCPIENIESIVEQCKAAGVPVWVKAVHIGTTEKFKIIHKFNELPEEVRIRELSWICQ